jgi:hypothetical protein
MRRTSRAGAVLVAVLAVGMLTTGVGGVAGAVTPPGPVATPACHQAPPTLSGTVVSVSTSGFRLALSFGLILPVATNPATTYAETGAVVPPTGVLAGEQVTVTLAGVAWWTRPVTAASVLVVLPHVLGTVVSVGAGSFSLQLDGGLVLPVGTTPTTDYRMSGTKESGVVAGEQITAYGALDPTDPAQLIAWFVIITPPTGPVPPPPGGLVSGTVTWVGPPGFTMSGTGGSVITVTTSTTTTYGETGAPSFTGGVAVGEEVRVTPVSGVPPTPTAVTAARVVVVLTQVTGTVRSIRPGGLTLTLFGGLIVTVDTDGSTVYAWDGTPIPGVFAGLKVTAYGAADVASPEQLDASYVDVDLLQGPHW